MHCLNIHLHSFQLGKDIIQPNDKVRVSITTIPEKNKQAFIIEAKKIDNVHHVFSVNITDQTKKVFFVFRKKSYFQGDPIIASVMIDFKDLPNLLDNSQGTKARFYNFL